MVGIIGYEKPPPALGERGLKAVVVWLLYRGCGLRRGLWRGLYFLREPSVNELLCNPVGDGVNGADFLPDSANAACLC